MSAPELPAELPRVVERVSRGTAGARVARDPTHRAQCSTSGVMEADEVLREASMEGEFSGAVLVRRADEVLLDQSFGFADREQQAPNMPTTRFQIASISKQFAAAAILLLQERGALSVSDSLLTWLPQGRKEWRPITIHELLTHTSGLGHWRDYDIDLFKPIGREELLEALTAKPLRSPPGESWYYSSPAFVLIAAIVELAAETPYDAFLETSIFGPLGMDSTVAGSRDPGGAKARGYRGEKPLPSFDLDTVNVGAGDIWSTARDLAQWDSALKRGSLLAPESASAMFRAHAPIPPEEVAAMFGEFAEGSEHGCGYGWFMGLLLGRRTIYHPGDNEGFNAWNACLPDEDLVVIVLSNDEHVKAETAGLRLIDLALRRKP